MRRMIDAARLRRLMPALGREAKVECRVYVTGGATAVLFGWRESTIDVDLKLVPDSDDVLRALPRLKEALEVNIEIASPADFIPELPAWQDRSLFIAQEHKAAFYHYDLYSQALAKVERGHAVDRKDVAAMVDRGLVDPRKARELFEAIESMLYRYPAIDPASFRRAVEAAFGRG